MLLLAVTMFCVTRCGDKTDAPSHGVAARWNTTSTRSIAVRTRDVRPIALEQEDRPTTSVGLSRSSLLAPAARGVTPAVKTRTCPQHCGTRSARHRDRT